MKKDTEQSLWDVVKELSPLRRVRIQRMVYALGYDVRKALELEGILML